MSVLATIGACIIGACIIGACIDKNFKDKTEQNEVTNILEKQRSDVLGRKINSITTILGDSINTANKVILLYDGFDCETCIDIGYKIIKKIDSLALSQKGYVITTSLNIGFDQTKNKYYKYVYYDENDIIRKELKYIYTPILLKLDSTKKVQEVFFPDYERDLNNETKFIHLCTVNY